MSVSSSNHSSSLVDFGCKRSEAFAWRIGAAFALRTANFAFLATSSTSEWTAAPLAARTPATGLSRLTVVFGVTPHFAKWTHERHVNICKREVGCQILWFFWQIIDCFNLHLDSFHALLLSLVARVTIRTTFGTTTRCASKWTTSPFARGEHTTGSRVRTH